VIILSVFLFFCFTKNVIAQVELVDSLEMPNYTSFVVLPEEFLPEQKWTDVINIRG
jgi:hypothetical protein